MQKILKLILFITLVTNIVFINLSTPAMAAIAKPFSERSDVSAFIDQMVDKHQFDRQSLVELFNNFNLQSDILAKMTYPAEAKPWSHYRKLFITEKRIDQGVEFWNEHKQTLAQVENEYGIPAEIIVSILGVETNYGKTQGHYPVFDTLTTLAFNYPERSKFFLSELQELLLLSRENQLNTQNLYGSYAGAFGQPQFMPSAYRYYAIDYTNKQQKDLVNNADDSIASIANFLKKHGWNSEQSWIATPVDVTKQPDEKYMAKTRKPLYELAVLEEQGIKPMQKVPSTMKAHLIALDTESNPQYWIGFENFYVIMSYNPRVNYAMAVYQLSDILKEKVTNPTSTQG